MKGWFKALGDAGRAIGYYHDAEARRSQAQLDSAKARSQLQEIQKQMMGDQAFGTVAGDVLGGQGGGGSQGGSPGASAPGGGSVPMPGATQMGGGQIQQPPMRANPGMVMAPQGSPMRAAAMPSRPVQGPPMPQGQPPMGGGQPLPQQPMGQGAPQGMPQGAPQQPQQGGGQISWPQLFSAIQRKGITDPMAISALVDRFLPIMNDNSKLQAQLYKAQIGYYLGNQRNQIGQQRADTYQQNADTTQNFDQGRLPIMQQNADSGTTRAGADVTNANANAGFKAGELPILQQNADSGTARAATGQQKANTDQSYKGGMLSVNQQKANTDQSYKGATGAAATTRAATGQANAATAAKRVNFYGDSVKKQRDWNDPAQRPQPRAGVAAQLAPADKVKFQQLMHADSTAAANYRSAVAFGGTDSDGAKAAKDEMNKTGAALAAFQPSAAPAASVPSPASVGFQVPAGAPDAKGQADGSILKNSQGNAVAKAQGGAWVAP